MSRWEALKSDTTGKGKGNRERRQEKHPQQSAVNPSGMQSDRARGQRGKTGDDKRIAEALENYVVAYKSNDGQDENIRSQILPKIVKSLDDFYKTYQESPRREIHVDSFPALIDLLCINDIQVKKRIARNLEFLLNEQSLNLAAPQAMKCVMELSEQCRLLPPTDSIFLNSLTILLVSQAGALPAEEMAKTVLDPLLLPCLESSSTATGLFRTICQTLSAMLQYPKHASAILAPLVADVTPDGKEKEVTNPIRKRIFSSLALCLSSKLKSMSMKQVAACYTLADTVEASRKIDQNSSTLTVSRDFDVSFLQGFFFSSVQSPKHSLFAPSMILLRSIVRKYSHLTSKGTGAQSVLDLSSHLIFEPSRLSSAGDYCCSLCLKRNNELGQFLSVVHQDLSNPPVVDGKIANLTMECLAEIITSMPWKLWLQQGNNKTNFAPSGFRRKLIDAVATLTGITRCAFLRCNETSIFSVCHLIRSCFEATQFEVKELLHPCIRLWSTLAKSLLSEPTSAKIQRLVVDLLIDSMGGRETPNGELLPIYAPARIWLLSSAAEPFLDSVYGDRSPSATNLLSAIFRTCPEVACSDSLMRFQSLFRTHINDIAKRDSLLLLESFLLGRRDFGGADDNELTKKITSITSEVLKGALLDTNVQNSCLCLSIYGALLSKDWAVLGVEDNVVMHHFKKIQSLCQAKSAKVRSTACKTIGDFCSHYIPVGATKHMEKARELEEISNSTCDSMLISLDDEKPNVRSMALFSLGNLAHVLRTSNALSISLHKITKVCTKIHDAMTDLNDKVSGNAIRSAGHWGYIAITCSDVGFTIVARIIEGLSGKLCKALNLVSDNAKGSLTWRQRSTAKKHCWGASHSLSCIFKGLVLPDHYALTASCSEGVRLLIVCVDKFYSLNEKIALASMSAICGLDKQQLAELAGKSGILGEALGTCIPRLYQHYDSDQLGTNRNSSISPKLVQETEQYLCHILVSASIMDASTVLKRDDISQSTLSFLYSWMVDKDLDGSGFEIFALALQRRGLMSSDVSLEQSFASRSLQQYKKNKILSSDDLELDDAEL